MKWIKINPKRTRQIYIFFIFKTCKISTNKEKIKFSFILYDLESSDFIILLKSFNSKKNVTLIRIQFVTLILIKILTLI